jgi:spore maturation protein CgeB
MKILVIAPDNIRVLHIVQQIVEELKNFGATINLFAFSDFFAKCSYFEKKMTTLGIKKFKRKYESTLTTDFENLCKDLKPDFVLILSGTNILPSIQEILSNYKTILWLWDSCRRWSSLEKFTTRIDEIFCFEYSDIQYLQDKYNIVAKYLHLGVNEKIYFPADCKKDIDISFVGWTSKERLAILEKVCELACKKNLSVKIGGPFHDNRHFWKKYLFGYRQKNLAHFLENRMFSPYEVADLYRRSKICLNINVSEHHSLNPRTFEICATKSFQMMNSGQNSNGLMNLETDLATFDSAEDLIEKIEFYLAHEELREKIALAGYNSVMKNCTLKKSVEKLLTESEIIRGLK